MTTVETSAPTEMLSSLTDAYFHYPSPPLTNGSCNSSKIEKLKKKRGGAFEVLFTLKILMGGLLRLKRDISYYVFLTPPPENWLIP